MKLREPMDFAALEGLQPPLASLRACFEVLPIEHDECPVSLAIAVPSPLLLERYPSFPRAAMPTAGRIANGRGLTPAACAASALGEAAELASCCAWGDETLVRASLAELGAEALDPARLLGLGEDQIAARAAWNDRWRDFDWRPQPVATDRTIAWIKVECAHDGTTAFAPADFVFIGRGAAGDETAVAIGDSNGCAAGASKDAARLAALLELIERDALARWWYGRRPRARRPLETLALDPGLRRYLAERGRRTCMFDITTDLRVPALAAASFETDGTDVCIGTSAALTIGRAAESALTEMLQMEVSLATVRMLADGPETWRVWRRDVTMATEPLSFVREEQARSGARSADLASCISACERAGISVYFVDLTRPELNIPAVRAIAPELCHFKPRFARRRLLERDELDGRSRTTGAVPNPIPFLV